VLADGIQLLLVGMTTVFAFLMLLVGLMAGSARFFEAFGHRFVGAEEPPPVAQASSRVGESEEIAVVLAAVEAHRRG